MGCAQQRKPTLDEVLAKLDENRIAYIEALPSLFAQEHAVSIAKYRRRKISEVVISSDSTFRILRDDETTPPKFVETRSVERIDGAVASEGASLNAPMLPAGIFANALMMVSASVRDCFHYKLAFREREKKIPVIEVHFYQKPRMNSPRGCPRAEDSSGMAVIDMGTMHILSIEKEMPIRQKAIDSKGKWIWKVEYAPVQLGAREFWLPRRIVTNIESDKGLYEQSPIFTFGAVATPVTQNSPMSRSFEATYTNFHLFHAEAHVVPAKEKDRNEKDKDENAESTVK